MCNGLMRQFNYLKQRTAESFMCMGWVLTYPFKVAKTHQLASTIWKFEIYFLSFSSKVEPLANHVALNFISLLAKSSKYIHRDPFQNTPIFHRCCHLSLNAIIVTASTTTDINSTASQGVFLTLHFKCLNFDCILLPLIHFNGQKACWISQTQFSHGSLSDWAVELDAAFMV